MQTTSGWASELWITKANVVVFSTMASTSDAASDSLFNNSSEHNLEPGYGTFVHPGDPDKTFGGAERRRQIEKTLLRKLDVRVAFLVLVYVMNYSKSSNKTQDGSEQRSSRTAERFGGGPSYVWEAIQYLLSILYVGYMLMQTPSNWFLNRIAKPSIYISCCIFSWGVISVGTGASQSYYSALVSRFLLGFVEAAFFPGALFLLSQWYKRHELGLRMAILTCGSSVSNAFGSLVASGILAVMDGKLGFAAWR
ncbi:major facilitator superfamily domain-containing protein [Melanogaster broomeanus]|nr:major facilitator superfamily domain-containing protein [Melanogaster broomeanus]